MPEIDKHERAWKAAWLILAAIAVPSAFWIQFVGVCYTFVIGPIAYYGSTIIATSLIAFSTWVIARHGHRNSDDDDWDT